MRVKGNVKFSPRWLFCWSKKAKASPNSRAATELWKRLFGDLPEEELSEEQVQVWRDAVAAVEAQDAAVHPAAPVASLAARQQLDAFVRETNLRDRATATTPAYRGLTPSPVAAPRTSPPQAAPTVDLRVPVGDANNMVHLAQ